MFKFYRKNVWEVMNDVTEQLLEEHCGIYNDTDRERMTQLARQRGMGYLDCLVKHNLLDKWGKTYTKLFDYVSDFQA